MPRKFYLFFLGLFLFSLFVLFSYLVHKDVFVQFDFDTTVRLQDNITRRVDDIFSAFSDVGKFEITLIFLVLIFVFSRKIIAGITAIAVFAGFHVIELYGKIFVHHPPPPEFLLRTKTIIDFPQFHVRSDNSYPSGHAGRTMFISVILFVLIWQSKRLNIQVKLFLSSCILVFDGVMLVSRIYLGEHWATDVLGGSLLGAGLGLISISLFAGRAGKSKIFKNSGK